jgi:hypothetical protein
VVGSCENGNEHSGYVNSRGFLSSSAVVLKGILSQNRKEFSSKMYGQYFQTRPIPSLNILHQTTRVWLIFFQNTSVFPVSYHPANAPYSFIYQAGDGQRAHFYIRKFSPHHENKKSVITTSLNCRCIFSVEVADDGCLCIRTEERLWLSKIQNSEEQKTFTSRCYVHYPTNSRWCHTNMLLMTHYIRQN